MSRSVSRSISINQAIYNGLHRSYQLRENMDGFGGNEQPVPINCFRFIWTIENANCMCDRTVVSPIFKTNKLHGIEWTIVCDTSSLFEKRPVTCLLKWTRGEHIPDIELYLFIAIYQQQGNLLVSRNLGRKIFSKGLCHGLLEMPPSSTISDERKYSKCDLVITLYMWDDLQTFREQETTFARTCIGIETKHFGFHTYDANNFQNTILRKITLQPSSKNMPVINLIFKLMQNTIQVDVQTKGWKKVILLKVKFSVLIHNSSVFNTMEGDHLFVSNNDVWSSTAFASATYDGTLLLQCCCVISEGIVYSKLEDPSIDDIVIKNMERFGFETAEDTLEQKIEPSTALKGDLSDGLGLLLEEGTLSDKTILCGGKKYPVHSSILAARSLVFKAMFTTDMKEKNKNECEITDMDEDIMKRLLLFLYTDTVSDLVVDSALKLYAAADKYDITMLKQICSSFLKQNLAPGNACSILQLSDDHNDVELKNQVKLFILEHGNSVINSDAWEKLMKERCELASEVLIMKWKAN